MKEYYNEGIVFRNSYTDPFVAPRPWVFKDGLPVQSEDTPTAEAFSGIPSEHFAKVKIEPSETEVHLTAPPPVTWIYSPFPRYAKHTIWKTKTNPSDVKE